MSSVKATQLDNDPPRPVHQQLLEEPKVCNLEHHLEGEEIPLLLVAGNVNILSYFAVIKFTSYTNIIDCFV